MDRFRGPKSFWGFRETGPRQFTVNRVLCSFTNDIGNPYSCAPLISLCVTFVRLSNLATFLCRLKYCYCVKLNVQQLCRVSALLCAGGGGGGGSCTRLEDFSPSKICQPYEQLCSTRLHQLIYTSSLYQPASSANSLQ